jgi:phosphoglycolate phosphatase
LSARECGLPIPSTDAAKAIIGLGIHDSITQLFPGIDADARTAFAHAYRQHFVSRDHEAPLYEGIRELLAALSHPQLFLAVATGKSRAGLERALARTELKSTFHFSRCADEGFPKPHPDMLLKLMDFTAVPAHRTLMIGDTTHDLDFAQNARVAAVAVTYGAHASDLLATRQSLIAVDTVMDLDAWLKQNL